MGFGKGIIKGLKASKKIKQNVPSSPKGNLGDKDGRGSSAGHSFLGGRNPIAIKARLKKQFGNKPIKKGYHRTAKGNIVPDSYSVPGKKTIIKGKPKLLQPKRPIIKYVKGPNGSNGIKYSLMTPAQQAMISKKKKK